MSSKLKDLIDRHKISQSKLARIIEVSRPTVIKILSGEREIRMSEADRLAMNLGISVTEIFGEASEVEIVLKKKSSNITTEKKERISVPAENVAKFKNALLYITQKVGALPNVGQTVLYKILYFCDFDYYEKYEEQLIGATYIKNHYGPTPREFSKIIKEMMEDGQIEEVIRKFYDRDQKAYLSAKNPDLSVFSGRELQHIDAEIARLGHKTAKELSDFSHKDIPWISTAIGKDIPYEAVFYRTKETSVRTYEND